MDMVITDECKDMLAKDGYNPTYGARPLRRSIQRLLEDALAEQVLAGNFKEGDTIEATLDGETIKFQKAAKKAEPKKVEKAEKSEKAEKTEKADKGDKAEKSEKPAAEDSKPGEETAASKS
jgi:ATP-dependent Clp protease ATP-binding subunit ClpC